MAGYREQYFENNSSNMGWYTCVRCGKKLRKGDVDIDHIVPQSYGGANDKNNLQCMCKTCNRSKQNSLKDTIPDYTRNTVDNTKKDVSKALGGMFGKK